MKAAATVTIAFLVVLGASMGSVAGTDQEVLDRVYKEQYAGWGGIILRCLHEEKSEPGKRICDNIRTDAEFLAATAKVPFHGETGSDPGKVYAEAMLASLESIPDGLYLDVEVRITGSDPIAAAVGFEAGDYYSEAIDQSDADGPAALPKSGTLVFWSPMMVAYGPNQSAFFSGVRDATETTLKQFFSTFVKHWTKPEDLP